MLTRANDRWALGVWFVVFAACGGGSSDDGPEHAAAGGSEGPAPGLSGGSGDESTAGGSASGATGGVSAGGAASGATSGVSAGGAASGATSGVSAGGSASGATGGVSAGGAGGRTDASAGDGGKPSVSKYEACVAYMNAQCNRRQYECAGTTAVSDPCPWQLARCPDFLFAEGSNRTVEEVLACADEWLRYPCEKANRLELLRCGSPGQRELGELCVFGSQCASRHCGGLSLDGKCAVCIPEGELGDACYLAEPPIACPNGTECTGHGCGVPPVFNLPAGSDCERAAQCAFGHWCAPDPSDGVERCQRIAALGEDCTGVCEAGATCAAASSKCEPAAAPGEPCTDGYRCAPGAICNRDALPEPVCERRMAIGESCIRNPQEGYTAANCDADLTCVCTDASCQAASCYSPGKMGDACGDPSVRCVPGTECQGGVCIPLESQGLADACNP